MDERQLQAVTGAQKRTHRLALGRALERDAILDILHAIVDVAVEDPPVPDREERLLEEALERLLP